MAQAPAMNRNKGPAKAFAVAAMTAAAAVLVTGLAVLVIGWIGGVSAFRRIHSDFAAMAPSTALCFALSGALVVFELRAGRSRRSRHAGLVVSAVIFVIAAMNLVIIAATVSDGIDALLFPGEPLFRSDHMATATSLCFILAAISHARASAALGRPAPAGRDLVFIIAASAGLAIALIALTGYLFDAEALYEISPFTAMALHTALSFAALFAALLLSRPTLGWVGVLASEGPGGRAARRVAPAVVLGPLAGAYLTLLATRSGALNADFRLALLAVLMMAALSALVLFQAGRSNADHARLEAALTERERLLSELNHRVRNHVQLTGAVLARARADISVEPADAALLRAARRVEALGAPHRAHTPADPADQVPGDALLKAFAEPTMRAFDGVSIETRSEPVLLSMDLAAPLALALSELAANAAETSEALTVNLQKEGQHLRIEMHSPHGWRAPLETLVETHALLRGLLRQVRADSIEEDARIILIIKFEAPDGASR